VWAKKQKIMESLSRILGQTGQALSAAKNLTNPRIPASAPQKPTPTPQKAPKTEPHVRLTAPAVKAQWQAGILNATGYLLNLCLSLKAPGWRITIPSVQDFCDKWGLHPRAFFRAKNKLISLGYLDQTTRGTLTIWVRNEKYSADLEPTHESPITDIYVSDPPDLALEAPSLEHISVSFPDTSIVNGDKSISVTDFSVTQTPLQAIQESSFQPSSDLLQISINSLSDRELKSERENSKDFSEEEKDAYREWLLKKADNLPRRPMFMNQWVTSQMKKEENQQEFLKHREAQQERANQPLISRDFPISLDEYSYPLAQLSPQDQRQNTLARLKAKWHQGPLRSAAIAEAQKWGFLVTDQGITEV
jgi:hypothetical protein